MNIVMYYGGFTLAVVFLLAAILFFIVFKVPSIHKYFKRNSRKGLVAGVVDNGKKQKTPTQPKRITREEYNNRTEIISLTGSTQTATTGKAAAASPDTGKTEYLPTQATASTTSAGNTAPTDQTEIL